MNNRPKKWLVGILAVVGLGLAAVSLLELHVMTPRVLQYCALPNSGDQKDAPALAKVKERISESLGDAATGLAFSMVKGSEKLSFKGREADCTVYAIGEGWPEVYPRYLTWGRNLNSAELKEVGRVCVMDEKLAFQLFSDPLPENPRIDFLGYSYRLVGTVRHAGSLLGGDGVGDQQPYDMYISLPTALKDGFDATVEMLSAIPAADTGVEPQFLQAAKTYWKAGNSLINLPKEAMRVTILPRMVLLAFGIYGLGLLLEHINRFMARLRARYREATKHNYLKTLWPRLLGLIVVHIISYTAVVALAGVLAVFSAQPVYIFTEWVPENFVAWSSISKVFWNLTREAGGLVRVGSRELRFIAFWGGALRWATVLLLIASAIAGSRWIGRKKEGEAHDRFV